MTRSPLLFRADVPAYPLSFAVFSAPSPTRSLLLHDLPASLSPANHSASAAFSFLLPFVPFSWRALPTSAQPSAPGFCYFSFFRPFPPRGLLRLGHFSPLSPESSQPATSHYHAHHHPTDNALQPASTRAKTGASQASQKSLSLSFSRLAHNPLPSTCLEHSRLPSPHLPHFHRGIDHPSRTNRTGLDFFTVNPPSPPFPHTHSEHKTQPCPAPQSHPPPSPPPAKWPA